MTSLLALALGACSVSTGDTGMFDSMGSADGSSSETAGATDPGTAGPGTADSGTTADSDSGSESKFDLPIGDIGVGMPDESTCAVVEQSLSSAGCRFAPFVSLDFWEYPWAVVAANAGTDPANVTLTSKDGDVLEARHSSWST